jgi:alpha-N-arabinofuranosidase
MSRTYHIAKNGCDRNAGTEAAPFLTIQRAAELAQAGDRVIVHEGVYREWVRPQNGGWGEDSRIIYEAAAGERAVIKGSEQITGWTHVKGTVWKVTLPEDLFGGFNPYRVPLGGDWFVDPKNYPVHPGEVYLNGKSFYEAASLEKVMRPQKRFVSPHETWGGREEKILEPEQSVYQWFCESDENTTTIYANFQGADPNRELVEINVRKFCFFPEQTGLNYITVRGFEMAHAATAWAPPTAMQEGLIGPNWSRGWVIEDNIIHDAKCCGISIGKEASTGQNDFTRFRVKPGYQNQLEAVFKARHTGWSRERIGSHIIRNNVIYDCGQAGLAGHLGCIFSEIYDNEIYNIAVYLSGNVGSGTVQEFSDWVEYCNMGGQSPMSEERRRNGQDAPWNVKYWGIGNEAWGCGGNMQPEFYANLCRQYATYLRSYSKDHPLYKIASGANVDDYQWTKVVMEQAGQFIDAVSLHYYTLPRDEWGHKGSATDFDRAEYFTTLYKTLRMDDLIENHSRIIRQYQGERKVGLAVDEWGTWFDVEPGTNPGFLFQQNTMRDALVAAINLNIFNNHCDTVVMANIAQVVNVLQAMILTEGPRMLLTPTYHVFEMYKGHQDAKQLESYVETALVSETNKVPNLHISASQSADGKMLVTVANLNDAQPAPLDCILAGLGKIETVTGRVISGKTDAYNTFDAPEAVKPAVMENIQLTADGFQGTLPACSVAAFQVTVK